MTNRGTGFIYPKSGITLSGVSPSGVNGANYTIMGYFPMTTSSVLTSGQCATFMLNIGTDSLGADERSMH